MGMIWGLFGVWFWGFEVWEGRMGLVMRILRQGMFDRVWDKDSFLRLRSFGGNDNNSFGDATCSRLIDI
jgi:hypothetical protein